LQDKDNIFANPFVSPVIKKQLKSTPFKPLVSIKAEVPIKPEVSIKTEVRVKTEAFTPPRTTKNEPQIESEQTVAGAVQALIKKEVTIRPEVDEELRSMKKEVKMKSEIDEELRSSPIIDKFHDLSTVSPQKISKESSPLKRKISVESGIQRNAVVKSDTRAIKRTKK